MMKANSPIERRTTLQLDVRNVDIERFFKKGKIADLYQKVRNGEKVKRYYQEMIDRIKQLNPDGEVEIISQFLEDEEVINDNELVIKIQLVNLAIYTMLSKGRSNLKATIISLLTEENLMETIDDLEDILCETLCNYYVNKVEALLADLRAMREVD